MFSFLKKQCGNCPEQEAHVDYKAEVERLKKEVDSLQSRIDTAYTETSEAEFMFDFSAVKAFSVERNWNNGRPVTIIGYMLTKPFTTTEDSVTTKEVVREWYLYCSKQRHAEIVEQFKQHIKGIK